MILNLQLNNIQNDASTLSFLDVQVELLNDGYKTNVRPKYASTDLFLHFNAMCPKM